MGSTAILLQLRVISCPTSETMFSSLLIIKFINKLGISEYET